MVAGCFIWDTCFRSHGDDAFSEDFLREFDAEYVVNSIDELRETGLFEYFDGDEDMEYPQRLIRWPIGSKLLSSPVCISIEENSDRYTNSKTGNRITWSTLKWQAKFSEVSEELHPYKYLYTIYLAVPNGQIWYNQAGNSRKECMKTAQENLLWIMSLLNGADSENMGK